MRLEIQRLLARGVGSLPRRLIIDVGGLLRRCHEVEPTYTPWPDLVSASRRSHRQFLWVAAPVAWGEQTPDSLQAEANTLRAAGAADILVSAEPVGALLASTPVTTAVGVISAGLAERPYELWLLDKHVAAMLDVESGIVWTRELVARQLGVVAQLPELHAIVGTEAGEIGLGGRAATRRREAIAAVLNGSRTWNNADVHSATKALVLAREADIAARAADLRGAGRADAGARAALGQWVAPTSSQTAYVIARVIGTGGQFQLEEVRADVADASHHAVGDAECTNLLRRIVQSHPARWFAPRALDLLAAIEDRGVPLPTAVVDPGLVAFAVEPAAPPSLANVLPDLPVRLLRWMQDLERIERPPRDAVRFCDVLEDLDSALSRYIAQDNLTTLVEHDLAPTLPVLARIERQGAWVDVPDGHTDWDSLRKEVANELAKHEAQADWLRERGIDIRSAPYKVLVAALKRSGRRIPSESWSADLTPKDEFRRLAYAGDVAAASIEAARSLVAKSGSHFWLQELGNGTTRLRGKSAPQTTGRWATRDLPLQNVPKRSPLGKAIRSGLVAPPGCVLVGADQNGFEVRLLADLSGDPELLRLAQQPEIHNAIAEHLFGTISPLHRRLAKRGMYAALYGQGEDGFRRANFELSSDDAVELYRRIRSVFAPVFEHGHKLLADYNTTGELRTRGGWLIRKRPHKTEGKAARSVFNATVQGLGADIQRWILRELDPQLRAYRARIVHQAHDELFVAVPDGPDVHTIRKLVVDTMTTGVMHRSGLLRCPVPLVATPHVGRTWRDMI